ncbi:MAG: hypothetical protein K2L51_00375, partial [Clostridiales bacterium]|nr:hypothetical protein [Clostridiales bacterium]
MKSIFKKILGVGMAMLMTFGVAACGGNKGNGNGNGNDNVGDGDSGTTINIVTAAERADYLARGADAHYATYDANGDVLVAGYYNALEGGTDGAANCYEYSAMIDMANYMVEISKTEADKAYYKKLFDGYLDGLKFFRGSGKHVAT